MPPTEKDLRKANTTTRRSQNQIASLARLIRNQDANIFLLSSNILVLDERLRHLEENAVIRS